MARKNETLAQTVRGEFCRNLGWQRGAHGRLAQPRFYLGYDEDAAKLKLWQLESVWLIVDQTWKRDRHRGRAVWMPDTLAIAKAVARGDRAVTLDPRDGLTKNQMAVVPDSMYASYLTQLAIGFTIIGYGIGCNRSLTCRLM